jgi:hypothetical protein
MSIIKNENDNCPQNKNVRSKFQDELIDLLIDNGFDYRKDSETIVVVKNNNRIGVLTLD